MDVKELKTLVKQGECYSLDFKQSIERSHEQDRIVQVLCSFANHLGGTVLVGVADDGEIAGIEPSLGKQEQLISKIFDSTEDPIAPLVEPIPLGGGKVVIRLKVSGHPRAAHTVKGIAYIRVGSETRRMSKAEYEKRIREYYPLSWERVLVENATEEDFDFDAVRTYIKRYEKEKGKKLGLSPRQALLARDCAIEANGKLKPTRAGILLFGKEPQRFFMKSHITVVRFGGKTVTDRILDSRDLDGSLINIIDKAENYVKDHYDTMIRLVGGKVTREDIPQYPPWAVRELIVNAVAHRDYSIAGSRIMIQMFRDRIEFHSPGDFPGNITPETAQNAQQTRNPVIARVLHDLGYIEQFGTGLNRVFALVREHPLNPKLPTIQEIGNQVIVTLYSPKDFLVPRGGSPEAELNKRQRMAVAYVKKEGSITNAEYQKITGAPKRTATRDLQELVAKGTFIKKGTRGRGTEYVLST